MLLTDGAICGIPATCCLKSLNISFDAPATAWHWTQPALPKKSTAPRFCDGVSALSFPRA
jgi:hypothetical protein